MNLIDYTKKFSSDKWYTRDWVDSKVKKLKSTPDYIRVSKVLKDFNRDLLDIERKYGSITNEIYDDGIEVVREFKLYQWNLSQSFDVHHGRAVIDVFTCGDYRGVRYDLSKSRYIVDIHGKDNYYQNVNEAILASYNYELSIWIDQIESHPALDQVKQLVNSYFG